VHSIARRCPAPPRPRATPPFAAPVLSNTSSWDGNSGRPDRCGMEGWIQLCEIQLRSEGPIILIITIPLQRSLPARSLSCGRSRCNISPHPDSHLRFRVIFISTRICLVLVGSRNSSEGQGTMEGSRPVNTMIAGCEGVCAPTRMKQVHVPTEVPYPQHCTSGACVRPVHPRAAGHHPARLLLFQAVQRPPVQRSVTAMLRLHSHLSIRRYTGR
jgi:hypothetical protein